MFRKLRDIFKVDPVIILKTIETNTIGPLKLIQSLVPSMMEKGEGRVINISSGRPAPSGSSPRAGTSRTASESSAYQPRWFH